MPWTVIGGTPTEWMDECYWPATVAFHDPSRLRENDLDIVLNHFKEREKQFPNDVFRWKKISVGRRGASSYSVPTYPETVYVEEEENESGEGNDEHSDETPAAPNTYEGSNNNPTEGCEDRIPGMRPVPSTQPTAGENNEMTEKEPMPSEAIEYAAPDTPVFPQLSEDQINGLLTSTEFPSPANATNTNESPPEIPPQYGFLLHPSNPNVHIPVHGPNSNYSPYPPSSIIQTVPDPVETITTATADVAGLNQGSANHRPEIVTHIDHIPSGPSSNHQVSVPYPTEISLLPSFPVNKPGVTLNADATAGQQFAPQIMAAAAHVLQAMGIPVDLGGVNQFGIDPKLLTIPQLSSIDMQSAFANERGTNNLPRQSAFPTTGALQQANTVHGPLLPAANITSKTAGRPRPYTGVKSKPGDSYDPIDRKRKQVEDEGESDLKKARMTTHPIGNQNATTNKEEVSGRPRRQPKPREHPDYVKGPTGKKGRHHFPPAKPAE